jgi:hypothetical protein
VPPWAYGVNPASLLARADRAYCIAVKTGAAVHPRSPPLHTPEITAVGSKPWRSVASQCHHPKQGPPNTERMHGDPPRLLPEDVTTTPP